MIIQTLKNSPENIQRSIPEKFSLFDQYYRTKENSHVYVYVCVC